MDQRRYEVHRKTAKMSDELWISENGRTAFIRLHEKAHGIKPNPAKLKALCLRAAEKYGYVPD